MGEAQERLDRLIKAVWGPVLRELGLKGSGKIWTLPDERDWAMLGFQTSSASTGAEAKFTMNLLVVGKAEWDAMRTTAALAAKPSPNTIALHRFAERAGQLTHGRDHWYRLAGDGCNEQQVGTEVGDNLRNIIVPKLRSELVDQSPGPRGGFAPLR